MRSVIMLAYFFPPEGSAGAYRPLRFLRHLPATDWRVRVISLDTDFYERYDPELLAFVPSDTTVLRVRGRDPWQTIQARRAQRTLEKLANSPAETVAQIGAAHQARLRSRIREFVHTVEAWCYHPDTAMSWVRPTVQAIVRMCAHERPDVIWATAGPVSSLVAAQQASQRTGVPYVVDFRDPWTVTHSAFGARRPAWARHADQRTMHRILGGARAAVFLYDTMAECYWRLYRGALDASKIHIIPNGYDGTMESFAASVGDKCTIVHTGTLFSYRYDTLLQALHCLKKSDPARARQLHLLFVGEGTEALANEVSALGLSDIVATTGPVSHAESTRLQREAHALLVLGRPQTMKGHELFAGAKLFGYLKASRPIVGVLPQDETNKILHRVGVSTVANVESPSEIVAVLRQLLAAWSAGTLSSLVPDRAACEIYSAERQTAALVRALDGAPAAEPFIPGSAEIPPSLRRAIDSAGCTGGGE